MKKYWHWGWAVHVQDLILLRHFGAIVLQTCKANRCLATLHIELQRWKMSTLQMHNPAVPLLSAAVAL